MKKKLILAILLIFLNIVVACSPSEPLLRLDQPLNLKVVKNVVSFDPVEFADYYILNINSTNIELTETTYTIEESGTYRVQVKAVGENFTDSLFSTALTFEVRFLTYPKNIQVINRLITYDEVDGADSYNIDINGEIYNTKERIVPSLEPGTYFVRIQSLSNQFVDSIYSPMIVLVVTEQDLIISNHIYGYSLKSSFDLPLITYKEAPSKFNVYLVVDSVETEMDYQYVYLKDQTLYLTEEYLEKFKKDDSISLRISTNLGRHQVTIKINETSNPYIYNDIIVRTNLIDDLTFNIEVFDFKLFDVFNSNKDLPVMDEKTYTFERGVLTIHNDYIKNIFESNLELHEIKIMIRFVRDNRYHVIDVYIRR